MIPLKDNIPSSRFPVINYLFIGINIAVFIYEIMLSPAELEFFIKEHAIIPANFLISFPSEWKTIFTSMFLHGGWLHIMGNMLFLYIFGDNVEDILGHFRYFIFYILSGVAAALVQIFSSVYSIVPIIGASGAVAGVIGAYVRFFPSARILTLVPFGIFTRLVELPAFFFIGIWFIMQLFQGTLSLVGGQHFLGGVAWWAHIGGFLFGIYFAGYYLKSIIKKISRRGRRIII